MHGEGTFPDAGISFGSGQCQGFLRSAAIRGPLLQTRMLLCQALRLVLSLVLITSFSPPVLLSIGCWAGKRPQAIGRIKTDHPDAR